MRSAKSARRYLFLESAGMIRSIRNFLCNTDPVSLTFGIGFVLLIVIELFVLGIVPFLFIVVIGLALGALVLAMGWLLYKSISLLQRFCK